MPEYLAPGVFVEEVSFRAKTIEGVPTSTTGMVGVASYGPCAYPSGPRDSEPRLVTSFAEYERVYGRLAPLAMGGSEPRHCYLGHAARAFFLNGGKRLYVARVVSDDARPAFSPDVVLRDGAVAWRARWPGRAGNVAVRVQVRRSDRLAVRNVGGRTEVARVLPGSVVEAVGAGGVDPNGPLSQASLHVASADPAGGLVFTPALGAATEVVLVQLDVEIAVNADRVDRSAGLDLHRSRRRFIGQIFSLDEPEDETAVVWLALPSMPDENDLAYPIDLLMALTGGKADSTVRLSNGSDGSLPPASVLNGDEADLDDATRKATGLAALAEIDDIAIVAMPDAATLEGTGQVETATQFLIRHAERCRYRIAVVDPPPSMSMNKVRAFRGFFDSKYAALYHPWIEILDPSQSANQGAPPNRIVLPPSGFVCGIYARNDTERGVYKAPANEVVVGLTRFEANINTGRQEVLNPEGINALRFFAGRGNRVWGARTLSSDPEWKYVNVRRLFIFLEHSIDKATQWAVFEPNNESLWRNVTRTVKDFLEVQWRSGALLGTTPEEAFFVRCDRTTMTQNDLDNGRLICLIGVAPTRPAEFVVFRIGQWTADSRAN